MRKALLSSAPVLAALVLASCAAPPRTKPAAAGAPAAKEAAAPAAATALEGTWQEIRNEDRPVTGKTWTFAGGRVVIHDGGTTYAGAFAADESRDPKEIDFSFDGYPTNQGIFLLTGDILTLKVRESAAERAKKFGIEKGYTLILCDRAKEKTAK